MTLPEFSAELRRLENLVGGGKSPDHFAALQRELPAEWQVQAQGRVFSIATAPLRLLLRKDSNSDAEAWLHNLRAQVDSAAVNDEQHAGDASAELKNILADSRFAAVAPPGWFEVQKQKVYRWIGQLFDKVFSGMARHPLGTEILFWVLIAAAVGFVAMLVWRYFARRDGMNNWQAEAAAPMRLRSWQEWLRGAREAAGRGDYREAVHSAYWSGIFRLQDTGALPRDRAKTPREYLRALDAPRPASAESREQFKQPLAAITTLFERVWYANRGARAEDFTETLRQLEALGCRLD